MKKFIAYIILFCLVFLNIPRGLTHQCNHDTKSHKQSKNSKPQKSFDADDCFACEFDLDSAHVIDFKMPCRERAINVVLINSRKTRYCKSQFDLFLLRGPPVV